MKNWKTTISGLALLGALIGGYFLPQHKSLFNDVIILLTGLGLIAAKDSNVTGGTKEQ